MSNTCARFIHCCLLILTLSLWAGRAGASVGGTQSFDIGSVNLVFWTGGIGSAQGQVQLDVSQMQQSVERNRYGGLGAMQGERGSLTQTASATGRSPSLAGQSATIKASQDLLGQMSPLAARGRQDLELKMGTLLFQPAGVGTVRGTQTYNGLQEQSVVSPCGMSNQSQSVDVRQSGTIVTKTDVEPLVLNRVTVGMHQAQVTTGQ